MIETSREEPLAKDRFSERTYFTVHRDNPHVGLYVSGPLRSKLSDDWIIALSRRLSRPDGSFAGIVVGTLQIDYFSYLFQNLKVGAQDSMSVVSTNGQLIMRQPFSLSEIGRELKGTELFKRFTRGHTGSYEALAAIDGVTRIFTYEQVENLPLIVTVGTAKGARQRSLGLQGARHRQLDAGAELRRRHAGPRALARTPPSAGDGGEARGGGGDGCADRARQPAPLQRRSR